MKNRTRNVLGLVLMGVAVTVTTWSIRHSGQSDITIGAVLELTGNISAYGKAAMNGISIAVEELNGQHYFGGRKLKVRFEDSASNAGKAVSGIQRLISIEKVPVVIGGISSSTTLAMAPVAERAHVVLLSPGASSPELTGAGRYIFRNYPSDLLEAKVLADYVASKGIRRIVTIYENTDYGQGLAKTFRSTLVKLGGTVVLEEGYLSESRDFKSIIAKLTQVAFDALYLPGYYQSVGILVRQLREAGVSATIYSSTGIEDPRFFDLAGKAGENVIYPTPSVNFQDPPAAARDVIRKYEATFKEKPNYPALLAYDALKIVALAIRDAGVQPDSICKALHRIRDFPGTTGATSFDANGDATKPFHLKIARGGRFCDL